MPGIAGVISRRSPESCRRTLASMIRTMAHESSYRADSFHQEDEGVYLAWTGLAEADGPALPVTNAEGNVRLFLAGQVFAEAGSGLSEVVESLTRTGEGTISRLNGQFAGVLLDRKSRAGILFNDRYGAERIFYHEAPDEFLFASEAKALLAVIAEARAFDPVALSELIACGAVLGTKSLFKTISIVPPGALWTFADRRVISRKSYFSPAEWENQEPLGTGEFTEAFVETFRESVRACARAPFPVGVSLTGGMDSRMIMACLETDHRAYPCYTFASMYRDGSDVKVGRLVADACGQPHQAIVLGRDFLSRFSRYMEEAVYRSDGYIGLSGAGELYVNEAARRLSAIRLTGNYGSELLRGARAFKSELPATEFLSPELRSLLPAAQRAFSQMGGMHPRSFALFEQVPHQGFGRRSVEKSQVAMRTPFLDNALVKLAYRGPAAVRGGRDLCVEVIRRHHPRLLDIPTDRGDLGPGGPLIRKIRNASEVILTKAEYWADHGMPQWAAAVSRRVPWLLPVSSLIGRNKFQHYRVWLQRELSPYARDVLLTQRGCSDQLDGSTLERMIVAHEQGTRNFTREIDLALTISLAEKLLIRRDPAEQRPAEQRREQAQSLS